MLLPVLEIRRRHSGAIHACLWQSAPNGHDPFEMVVWKRMQKDGIHCDERSDVRADAQSERQDGDGRGDRTLLQNPISVNKIAQHASRLSDSSSNTKA